MNDHWRTYSKASGDGPKGFGIEYTISPDNVEVKEIESEAPPAMYSMSVLAVM
jgi:hypothetical protein